MSKYESMKATKRDGRQEPIDLEKIHKVIDWAAQGLNNVSVSQVELKSHIQFYDAFVPMPSMRPSSSLRPT
ncbi:ATP cone domain-containing protein [Methylobacillus glycogenes]|uniref:ATP cone domain-containing protein n=1 Tax=Methylobacillus glycogenes TaxID=406 RepID=UPI001EEAC21F|nr:ATP cone domain-containing protein [Methylobacillus glycogenes]